MTIKRQNDKQALTTVSHQFYLYIIKCLTSDDVDIRLHYGAPCRIKITI